MQHVLLQEPEAMHFCEHNAQVVRAVHVLLLGIYFYYLLSSFIYHHV